MAKPTPKALQRQFLLHSAEIEHRMQSALQFQAPEDDFSSLQPSFPLSQPPIPLSKPSKPPKETTIRLTPTHKNSQKSMEIATNLVSEKSRLLAEKAEQRFFSKHKIPKLEVKVDEKIEVKSQNLWEMESAKPEKAEISPSFSKFSLISGIKSGSKGELRTKIREYLSKTPKKAVKSPTNSNRTRTMSSDINYFLERHEALSGPLQVAERGKGSTQARKERTNSLKSTQEQKKYSECTFMPVIYTRIPHHLQGLSASSLLDFESMAVRIGNSQGEGVKTPKSMESTATHTRVQSDSGVGGRVVGKMLSPVTYRLGMDWDRLEKGGNAV